MYYTASGQWARAREPLHRDVDLRKQHRCGVGPAEVCARALVRLRKCSPGTTPSTALRAIGLIPCAIGGASLDEWQLDYQGVVGDCEAPRGAAAVGAAPKVLKPWAYKPGATNLFSAMLMRTSEALKAAPEGSRLGGMLWYQGETDAMKQQTADTYLGRFETFVSDVREQLGFPDLKVFSVAVTATTDRLPHLSKVREAQLAAGAASGLPGVWVTDSFGLPMFCDGLHLTTKGQVELGERMAVQILDVENSERVNRDSYGQGPQRRECSLQPSLAAAAADGDDFASGDAPVRWASEAARISKVEIELTRLEDAAIARRESGHHAISQVTQDLEGLISNLSNRNNPETSPFPHSLASTDPRSLNPSPTHHLRKDQGENPAILGKPCFPGHPSRRQAHHTPDTKDTFPAVNGGHQGREGSNRQAESSTKVGGPPFVCASRTPPPPPENILVGTTATRGGSSGGGDRGAGAEVIDAPFAADSRRDEESLGVQVTEVVPFACPPNLGPNDKRDGDVGGYGIGMAKDDKCGATEQPADEGKGELGGSLRASGQGGWTECDFVSAVSSEVTFRSFSRLLFLLEPTPHDRLLLLGCGTGATVLGSALLGCVDRVQGMDLFKGCLDDARALLDAYNDDNLPRSCSRSGINMDDMNDSHDGQPSDSTKRSSSCTSGVSRMSSIDLVEGEFLEQDWGNPSVICMSSACFDEKIMADIAMRCREQLLTYERNTRVVVTLDKPLPKVMMLELENDQKEVRGVSQAAFEVVWQCQVEGCWGGAVVAYVHERVSKVIGG